MLSTPVSPDTPLLAVEGLRVDFRTRHGDLRAIDNVSFEIKKGEILGMVGESGAGKSLIGATLIGLLPQNARVSGGTIKFKGREIQDLRGEARRALRGRSIAMIYQDPLTSLNPLYTVGSQISDTIFMTRKVDRAEADRRAIDWLARVGLPDPERRFNSYPHEFSGGMRQRVMIAMALITKPDLLIADEPTTALDVTVQAQILELIKTMQRELGMAVILITHDLGIVSGFCDRVNVMYAGRLLEASSTNEIFYHPRHPYTKALQKSIPALQQKGGELHTIPGLPPDVSKPMPGCPFTPRCEHAVEYCGKTPIYLEAVEPGHSTACLRVLKEKLDL